MKDTMLFKGEVWRTRCWKVLFVLQFKRKQSIMLLENR